MLDRLKRFFAATDDAATDDQAVLHLAAAVLLVEVAKADHSLQESELERLKTVLAEHWGLGPKDLADLVEVAHDTAEADVSLHRQIDLINRHFTAGQKLDLVRGLWEVACADGEIHHHEEALIRRLADLIYVSHTDFIRSKHRALDNA
jgi:uncharacterized tellurite resistance protein B-like protein